MMVMVLLRLFKRKFQQMPLHRNKFQQGVKVQFYQLNHNSKIKYTKVVFVSKVVKVIELVRVSMNKTAHKISLLRSLCMYFTTRRLRISPDPDLSAFD
jgi:hypothetical protein